MQVQDLSLYLWGSLAMCKFDLPVRILVQQLETPWGLDNMRILHKSQKVFWRKTGTCRDGSLKNQPN